MNAQPPLSRDLLLIADISGYTGYLASSEPEEAPMIAGDLVGTVVDSLVPPFELGGLEGDAAFLHVDPQRLDGPGLISAISGCYDAFRRRVESLRLGSSCECSACRTVLQLDLKFFAHVGTVLHQRIAGRDELSGRDVILVHRLMKDSAPARAGAESYALLTDAVIDAFDIDPLATGLEPVRQEYEHLGVVDGYVLDSDSLRDAARQDPAAGFDGEILAEDRRVIDSSPSVVWELLTVPAGRQAWEGIESVEELTPGGLPGVGSRTRCVARHLTSLEEIVEWNPPNRLARRTQLDGIGQALVAYTLEPIGEGTSLTARWHADGEAPVPAKVASLVAALDRLEAVAVSR